MAELIKLKLKKAIILVYYSIQNNREKKIKPIFKATQNSV